MDDPAKVCVVCKQRPPTHRYAAAAREGGPLEDVSVCTECYHDLIQLDRQRVAAEHG